jgi:predicted Zn-dependent protease with MMP-like domain
MYRPSAQEFLQALLEALDDLPPDFARRFEEVLKKEDVVDRSQAIRQLFEDFAGE